MSRKPTDSRDSCNTKTKWTGFEPKIVISQFIFDFFFGVRGRLQASEKKCGSKLTLSRARLGPLKGCGLLAVGAGGGPRACRNP